MSGEADISDVQRALTAFASDDLSARSEAARWLTDYFREQAGAGASIGSPVDVVAACEPLVYAVDIFGFAPGRMNLLSAFANGAKTPTACLITACVGAGLPCLGKPARKAKVLYIAYESARVTMRKFLRICLGLGIDGRAIIASGAVMFLRGETFSAPAIETLIREHAFGLVVVDTISSALRGLGVARNDDAWARPLWDLGDVSERTGATILGLAHDNKSSGGTLRGIAGTEAIVAASHAVVSLEPDPDAKTLVTVRCTRALDAPFEDFRVRWSDGSLCKSKIGQFQSYVVPDGAVPPYGVDVPLRCEIVAAPSKNPGNDAKHDSKQRDLIRAAELIMNRVAYAEHGATLKEIDFGALSANVQKEARRRLKDLGAITDSSNVLAVASPEWSRYPKNVALQGKVEARMRADK